MTLVEVYGLELPLEWIQICQQTRLGHSITIFVHSCLDLDVHAPMCAGKEDCRAKELLARD